MSFGEFLVLLYFPAAGLLFVLALIGVRPRWLFSSAIALPAAVWIVFSFLAPSNDQDWTKEGFVFVYGLIAAGLALLWSCAIFLGWGIRTLLELHRRREQVGGVG